MRSLSLVVVAIVATGVAARAADADKPSEASKKLLGDWKQDDDKRVNYIRFEEDRFVQSVDGKLTFTRIAYTAGKAESEIKLLRRFNGERTPFATVELKDGKLLVHGKEKPTVFLRLNKPPDELKLTTLPLGEAKPLDPNQLKQELAKREAASIKVRLDLRELKKPDERAEKVKELLKIDAGDTKYLIETIKEVGWIDSGRFGPTAAHSAYLICMHTHDPRLMGTGVEQLKSEIKSGAVEAEQWAGLHDRFRFLTGKRERYGLTVFPTEDGLAIGPLEDKKRVDEFRKEIGLEPLAKYLERYQDQNGGKAVKVLEAD